MLGVPFILLVTCLTHKKNVKQIMHIGCKGRGNHYSWQRLLICSLEK